MRKSSAPGRSRLSPSSAMTKPALAATSSTCSQYAAGVLDPLVQGLVLQRAVVATLAAEVVVGGAEEEFALGDDAFEDADTRRYAGGRIPRADERGVPGHCRGAQLRVSAVRIGWALVASAIARVCLSIISGRRSAATTAGTDSAIVLAAPRKTIGSGRLGEAFRAGLVGLRGERVLPADVRPPHAGAPPPGRPRSRHDEHEPVPRAGGPCVTAQQPADRRSSDRSRA